MDAFYVLFLKLLFKNAIVLVVIYTILTPSDDSAIYRNVK